METKYFADIYEEIAVAAGEETAVKIHKLFKGQQILFPQKLYKKDYIYNYIRQNYNGKNVRELSQMFGYSDRRIRQILSLKTEV
jgi:Mor family transcriptional regulator